MVIQQIWWYCGKVDSYTQCCMELWCFTFLVPSYLHNRAYGGGLYHIYWLYSNYLSIYFSVADLWSDKIAHQELQASSCFVEIVWQSLCSVLQSLGPQIFHNTSLCINLLFVLCKTQLSYLGSINVDCITGHLKGKILYIDPNIPFLSMKHADGIFSGCGSVGIPSTSPHPSYLPHLTVQEDQSQDTAKVEAKT